MDYTLTVLGMTCGHCEKAIIRAIHNLDKQAEIQIDREQNLVKIESKILDLEKITSAIKEEGYSVNN